MEISQLGMKRERERGGSEGEEQDKPVRYEEREGEEQ